jgi:hypothetical protein
MRLAALCLCIVVVASACKNKGDGAPAPDPAAIKAQQELVARRDALLAQRDKLQGESAKLQEEIVKVQATGGDVAELEKKKQEIDSQLANQNTTLDTTSSELDKISSKLDAAGGVAAREARVAEREARVAEREKAAMAQMQKLMDLESKNAEKWKDSCGTGGGTTTVIQQIQPPKSGNYNRKEVDSLMGRAKAGMTKKGLLASEYERLQGRVKSAKVDEGTNTQLVAGMQEVMQKYGDGDFGAANRKINQLYGLIR